MTKLTIVQMLPALESGGVERGTLEIAKYLVQQGHRSIVISAGGRLVEKLIAEGSEHIAWDVGKKSIWTFRYVFKLRKLLAALDADILHLRSRLPAWIGYLAWKGMNPRPKLVTSVHGPYSIGRYSSVMVRGERVIAVSDMICDYIKLNYPSTDPNVIRRIYRGVDPVEYPYHYKPHSEWLNEWYKNYPLTEGKVLLTLPARITRWKGQELFINLIEKLVKAGYSVHGLIVGGAHPRKMDFFHELQKQIETKGLAGSITMVGHRSDLKEILAISTIVYSLSTEPEAFGRTTIEALSLGVPVIGFNHGGVAEQLRYCCPEGAVNVGDIDSLEERTKQWLMSPPEVSQEHPFLLQKMCEETVKVYQELLT